MDTALLNSSSLSRRYCVRRLSLSREIGLTVDIRRDSMFNLDEVTLDSFPYVTKIMP